MKNTGIYATAEKLPKKQTDLLCDYSRKLEAIELIISNAEELLKPKALMEEKMI